MMNKEQIFELALGINKPWYIKEIKFDLPNRQLDIYIDFQKGSRFYYEDEEDKGHYPACGSEDKTWRHLNFFQHECYLHARVPRIEIRYNKTRLIRTPWEGESKGFTLLFEALLLGLCSQMPVLAVSRIVNESDDKLWRMLDKYISGARELLDFSEVKSIGMDEKSIKKGHEYITLFVDLEEKKTIFVTQGKDNQTVKEFTRDLQSHNGQAENIKQVSCDMSPAFIKGVEENLPNAQITFDRYHVSKIINEAVDQVRRSEAKENAILKGTKYIFLKNKENLTENQKRILEGIKISGLNLKTIKALHIRENFQELYKINDKATFEKMLKKWYFWATHSRIEAIKEAAYMIKRHWDGIVNWVESKISNGILEGYNSVIQAIKAKARGYRTSKNFKIIIYLATGKLDFSMVNNQYPLF